MHVYVFKWLTLFYVFAFWRFLYLYVFPVRFLPVFFPINAWVFVIIGVEAFNRNSFLSQCSRIKKLIYLVNLLVTCNHTKILNEEQILERDDEPQPLTKCLGHLLFWTLEIEDKVISSSLPAPLQCCVAWKTMPSTAVYFVTLLLGEGRFLFLIIWNEMSRYVVKLSVPRNYDHC